MKNKFKNHFTIIVNRRINTNKRKGDIIYIFVRTNVNTYNYQIKTNV